MYVYVCKRFYEQQDDSSEFICTKFVDLLKKIYSSNDNAMYIEISIITFGVVSNNAQKLPQEIKGLISGREIKIRKNYASWRSNHKSSKSSASPPQ